MFLVFLEHPTTQDAVRLAVQKEGEKHTVLLLVQTQTWVIANTRDGAEGYTPPLTGGTAVSLAKGMETGGMDYWEQ